MPHLQHDPGAGRSVCRDRRCLCDGTSPCEQRGLTLTVSHAGEPSAGVLGDFSSLRRLLWILLDNALKYTHARGQV